MQTPQRRELGLYSTLEASPAKIPYLIEQTTRIFEALRLRGARFVSSSSDDAKQWVAECVRPTDGTTPGVHIVALETVDTSTPVFFAVLQYTPHVQPYIGRKNLTVNEYVIDIPVEVNVTKQDVNAAFLKHLHRTYHSNALAVQYECDISGVHDGLLDVASHDIRMTKVQPRKLDDKKWDYPCVSVHYDIDHAQLGGDKLSDTGLVTANLQTLHIDEKQSKTEADAKQRQGEAFRIPDTSKLYLSSAV